MVFSFVSSREFWVTAGILARFPPAGALGRRTRSSPFRMFQRSDEEVAGAVVVQAAHHQQIIQVLLRMTRDGVKQALEASETRKSRAGM
jgi:hypothetical protein